MNMETPVRPVLEIGERRGRWHIKISYPLVYSLPAVVWERALLPNQTYLFTVDLISLFELDLVYQVCFA